MVTVFGMSISLADLIPTALLVATTVGIFLSFAVTYRELSLSRRITKGEFLLHLDELFRDHKEVHRNLRPAGKWGENKGAPATNEEWESVDAYMGLFERIKILINGDIIDVGIFNQLYGYRVQNIVQNDIIRQSKLESNEAGRWKNFVALCKDDIAIDLDKLKKKETH